MVCSKRTSEHEEWYTKADIKIMFFGKEPNGWERDNAEEHLDVGDLMATYEDFLDDNYVAIEGTEDIFVVEPILQKRNQRYDGRNQR